MQTLPHHYHVTAKAEAESNVELQAEGLNNLISASPAAFGGPGDQWSPEELLVASLADCFVLTFKAIAAASRFDWHSLQCGVTGTLDKIERKMQFTHFHLRATLVLAGEIDNAKARALLEKSEANCLISNSLRAHIQLDVTILPLS